jgi:UDP-N-acetyl-2-amino-2-deoxyglucuronate dehydrogenase
MANDQVLRIGIAGCGGQGQVLANAVNRMDELQLVACADPDRPAASRVAALSRNVTPHASLDGLLGETEVDAVLIATTHHMLAPAALIAIRAGKHVLIEKPIALNAREATELEVAAEQAGVCFMSGYSFRYGMAKPLRDLVDAGALGEIQAASGTIVIGPMNETWRAYPESGGGPLLYVGSHLVDLFLWFLGDPVEVSAHVRRRADTGADELSAFRIGFAGGAQAQGLVSQTAHTLDYSLEIIGREGRVVLRGSNFLQYEIEVTSRAMAAYGQTTVIRPGIWWDNIQMMFVPELADFAAAIRAGSPSPITARDGRRVLQVLDAITESGRTGVPVPLTSHDPQRQKGG